MAITRKFLALLLVAFTVAFSAASCVVQENNAGPQGAVVGQKYNRFSGNLSAKLGCSLFEADKAVRATAKKLQLRELSRRNEQTQVTYEFKDVYENRVDVDLEVIKGVVNITIKMGKGGDRKFSNKMMKGIAERIPVQMDAATAAAQSEPQPEADDGE